MRNIAFIGKARSGKDTAALRLVRHHAFTRVAFADPLKEMALSIDPIINTDTVVYPLRLSRVVELEGWERAKDEYPEVRRILQHVGQTVREYEPDFWLDIALRSIDGGAKLNMPIVVTDCRYPNEFAALRGRDYLIVRMVRPSVQPPAPYGDHDSETALDDFPPDVTLVNDGSVADLHAKLDSLVR